MIDSFFGDFNKKNKKKLNKKRKTLEKTEVIW